MQKYTLGIDIEKKLHAATLINDKLDKLASFTFTNTKSGYKKLTKQLNKWVDNKESLTVGMEATGHYWLAVYQYFKTK